MTKLGAIEFDDRILEALRDDRLVVFAGAGVSMGPPSNLASFWKLTCDIAQGTGLAPSEPLDRFLGQLHHRDVAVHQRAAQLLSPAGSAPNALHYDLLRLFRTVERIRLITTNFDLHFETAAIALFGALPDVYRAPALPVGYDFSGIVHVHGALPRARELVLTDADFGRAYLTEGWARRFLVDVFRSYTVLFVGYSHNDVVMNYLARALPADSVAGRFALTDEDGSWELLGVKPIRFVKGAGADSFKELYDGAQRLAERATRGALDWQSRLAELGGRAPPTDEEAIGEVEQALREVHTTRFLLNVARDPQWLRWLTGRKHLGPLFGPADLDERDMLLAAWLAQHFAIEHPDEVFHIVAAHGLRMSPTLWWYIGREIGVMKEKPLEESALKRWTTILLASAPAHADRHVLMWLAERCEGQGCLGLTLKVFMAMSKHRLSVKPGFAWPDEGGDEPRRLQAECPLRADHWSLNEVWTKHLKPHVARISQPLLSGIALRLEEMHGELTAWDKASREWDPVSYGRSAIEPHEQDQHREAVDVLVDAGRDALEWLAASSPALLSAWIERLVTSDTPLLRRLAIHGTAVHPEQSPEERLGWLLARVGLHGLSEHHEVHHAVARSYAAAADPARGSVVDAILAHTLPATDDRSAEIRTARSHFNWLSWLLQAKPDCALAGAALAPIRVQYPDWLPSDHPDLTHWVGSADWVGSESPWSVDQLLAREPSEQLNDLLDFKGNRFDGPSRDGLLANVREACKQTASWAFALAQALAERSLWPSDLWPALIRGLQESDLRIDGWRQLLNLTVNPALQSAHAHDIASLLCALVRDGGKPFALGQR
jgi:SIR2-like domain